MFKKILAWTLIIISIVFTTLLVATAINKNQEPVKAIQTEVTAEVNEVIEVAEPIPEVYVPVDMFDKDMFNERYSRYQICLVSALAYCEMGGSTVKAIMYVVSVVLNRVASQLFPNTIEEVVYQAGQYEPALNGTINKMIRVYYYNDTSGCTEEELEDYERVFEAVAFVFVSGSQLPEDVVYQAPFVQGSGVYEVIDGEYFCYE